MPKEWIYFYGLAIDAWYTPAALVHPDYSGRYRHPIATACVTSCLNIDTLACFQQDKLRTACRHARFGRIWLGLTGLFWVCVSLLSDRAAVFNRDHLLCGISAR